MADAKTDRVDVSVKADPARPLQEVALEAGFKAGWMAACRLLAQGCRETGSEGIALAIESVASQPPPVSLVRVEPEAGETPAEALARAVAGRRLDS